jgi:transporter family-2 protein
MPIGYVVVALIAGAVLPLQALINARLAAEVGGPVLAAAISFQFGAVCLLLSQLVLRAPFPSLGTLSAMPIWLWIGGLLGACYVTGAILSVPKLGAAGMVSLVIVGQMVAALILDKTGFLNIETHGVGPGRLAGAGLLLVGALMVLRF